VFKNKRILAVVPARGGSKGIPLKNLCKINGISLVGSAGDIARSVSYIDRAVVSTDHDDIAREAIAHGLDAPFRRPIEISGDRISDVEVLSHALTATEDDDGDRYDIVVMLQPTSPLRKTEHVKTVIEKLVNEDLDSVWTVSETDSKAHPLKQLVVMDGRLEYYDPKGATVVARQELKPVYHRNGIAYALTRDCLLERKSLLGPRAGAVKVEGHVLSIDTEWDLDLVEFISAGHD
jgi:CMP-N,N'-diacetyllegionaminic acid synthase